MFNRKSEKKKEREEKRVNWVEGKIDRDSLFIKKSGKYILREFGDFSIEKFVPFFGLPETLETFIQVQ